MQRSQGACSQILVTMQAQQRATDQWVITVCCQHTFDSRHSQDEIINGVRHTTVLAVYNVRAPECSYKQPVLAGKLFAGTPLLQHAMLLPHVIANDNVLIKTWRGSLAVCSLHIMANHKIRVP